MNKTPIYRILTDKDDHQILLSVESWDHIQEKHPEITENMIEKTLLNPILIKKNKQQKKKGIITYLDTTRMKTKPNQDLPL